MSGWRDQVERDEMSAAARRYSDRALLARDSQRFDFQVEGEAHSIVIRRGSFDPIGPSIEIDGDPAGRIVLPTSRRTFTERDFAIAGHEVIATLAANGEGPDPVADVFVDGRSVADGRLIDVARYTAPPTELLAGRFFGTFHNAPRLDMSGADEGCGWIFVIGLVAIGAVALLLFLVDVVLIVGGAVAVFWAANTIPGRRSVVDAIRWRLLAVETVGLVALILGAAWVLRH